MRNHKQAVSENRPASRRLVVTAVLCLMLAWSVAAAAQAGRQTSASQPAATQSPSGSTEADGENWGGYIVRQSFEFGGRISDATGNGGMYNTLVDQHSGPRLLEQTLSMQSPEGTGALFDSLYLSSFGWGGDPSNAARLRMQKLKWYNFNLSFRRDQNYFDYDLLANPLNPVSTSATVPTVQIPDSPHAFYNRRRMYDADLTILPQQRLSFRLGFSRNRNEGPTYSTLHYGTEALLLQPWSTTANSLRLGADFRALPQTTISYTQTFQFLKNDTDETLSFFPPTSFVLSNGVPVTYGVSWAGSNAPCAAPILPTGAGNPTCSGYTGYSRTQRMRTYIPTEQLSIRSSSLRRVDFTGVLSYSSADMKNPIAETFSGLESRTALVGDQMNGAVKGRWINVTAETGLTIYLTQRLRVVDTFHFNNYRVPAALALTGTDYFNDSTAASGSMILPVGTSGTYKHTTSSEADLINELYSHFVGQDSKTNEIQLQADLTRVAGVRFGYRFRSRTPSEMFSYTALGDVYYPLLPNRGNCASPPNPSVGATGTCTFIGEFDSESDIQSIHEHRGIIGAWFRPDEKFHVNLEAQVASADNYLVRLDPTREARFKADVAYVPKPWLNLGMNANIMDQQNHDQDFNFNGHLHDIGFNALLSPTERFGLDAAYNYSGWQQSDNICFAGTLKPAGTITCVNDTALLQAYGNYEDHTHFGTITFMTKPVKNLRLNLGYSITANDGSIVTLNALQPKGMLSSYWQQPTALLGYTFHKGWEARAAWNYYQYDENSPPGPTLKRYFHANNTTLSLRYEF